MNRKSKYINLAEGATIIAVIALIMAIPVIPAPVEVISTYTEKAIKIEPYTVTETREETVPHSLQVISWKDYGYYYGGALQSYLQMCFSLYTLESINNVSSKSASYVIETAGNQKREKINRKHNFANDSPFGIASDGSICIPQTGINMQDCALTASWKINEYYDYLSNSTTSGNCPFICFHNSPLLIPVSTVSNPAYTKLYASTDGFYNGCKGNLKLDLSTVNANKVWFSLRLEPSYDQNALNIDELQIDFSWHELQSSKKTMIKYRESEVDVPRQSSQIYYPKISLWQLLFNR